jgi:predicted small secreted protein
MKMKLSVVLFLLSLTAALLAGCADTEPVGVQSETGEVVSSCVDCHTDKVMLQDTAVEPEEVVSEETTGEG